MEKLYQLWMHHESEGWRVLGFYAETQAAAKDGERFHKNSDYYRADYKIVEVNCCCTPIETKPVPQEPATPSIWCCRVGCERRHDNCQHKTKPDRFYCLSCAMLMNAHSDGEDIVNIP